MIINHEFSQEFENKHPLIATGVYIIQTLIILGFGFVAIYGAIWFLAWATTKS